MKKNRVSRLDLIVDAFLVGVLAMQWDMWNDAGPIMVNVVHLTIAFGAALNLFNAVERIVKGYMGGSEE